MIDKFTKKECDRALERIEDEQEKMRLFKEDVKNKFGDLMDGDGLLESPDDDDEEYNNAGARYNGLGGFKLDGDDSQIIYDEAEPEWNRNRQPKAKYPKIPSGARAIPYNASDMSQTRTVNSFPSRSLRGPSGDYNHNISNAYDSRQQVLNDDQSSMLGVTQPVSDASLQSDLLGRRAMDQSNNSINNQHLQDSGKHSFV